MLICGAGAKDKTIRVMIEVSNDITIIHHAEGGERNARAQLRRGGGELGLQVDISQRQGQLYITIA